MRKTRLIFIAAIALSLCIAPRASAQASGWRGNLTGLYPDATPPLEWYRLPQGPMEGLRSSATRPDFARDVAPDAAQIKDGTIAQWIVGGPIEFNDPAGALERELIPHEAELQPALADHLGQSSWKELRLTLSQWDFGQADLPWIKVGAELNAPKQSAAYAIAYLHAARGGKLRAAIENESPVKIWMNGKTVFTKTDRTSILGTYSNLGRRATSMTTTRSPTFDIDVRPGWNRLIVKLVAPPNRDGDAMRFCLRLMDAPDVPYRTKNIAWMSELPNRSNATPIVAGDRIFVMSEPDELVCIDARTGRKLWSAINDDYQALSPVERAAHPQFAVDIDPLCQKLAAETDLDARIDVRREIREKLETIDPQFKLPLSGHLAGHFGIVGFTTPTPCFDGKFIYLWLGNGVAACYDIDGHRQWATLIRSDHLNYASSPALIGNRFCVFMTTLRGLNTADGKVVWEQPEVDKNTGAVLAGKIAGVDVIVSQQGEIIRASDGHMLCRSSRKIANDTGWAPPTIIGNTIYLPMYGVNNLFILDCSKCTGEQWKPTETQVNDIGIHRKPDGSWIDRWTAGSWLIHDGIAYNDDIWSTFYAVDLTAKKPIYRQDVDFHGFFHYNSIPVAASPTLGGNHIFISDNQGTTLVLEPGRAFHQIHANRIGTVLARTLPLPGQEAISYSPPVFVGNRIYIRGERYLYCIADVPGNGD